MERLSNRVLLAGKVRRARSSLSETTAQLLDVGLDDVALKLTNVECELEEIYLQLLDPLCQALPRPTPPPTPSGQQRMPF